MGNGALPCEDFSVKVWVNIVKNSNRQDKLPLRDAVRRVLNAKLADGSQEIEQILESGGIGKSNKNAVAMAMVLEAIKGNKSCAEWLRETAGEKDKERKKADGEQKTNGAVVFISGEEEILN